MSDTYAAIYNAVRSQIGSCDVRSTLESVLFQQFDISHARALLQEQIGSVGYDMSKPSVLFRPSLSIDGNMWCALYGDNLPDGVAGFGKSPQEAMDAFDKAWWEKLPERKTAADAIEDIRTDLRGIVAAQTGG